MSVAEAMVERARALRAQAGMAELFAAAARELGTRLKGDLHAEVSRELADGRLAARWAEAFRAAGAAGFQGEERELAAVSDILVAFTSRLAARAEELAKALEQSVPETTKRAEDIDEAAEAIITR